MARQPIPKTKMMVKRNKQHSLLFEDADEKQFIDLTPDWISTQYDRMNQALFDGKLGGCRFKIFTSGKGSEGRRLGYFDMGNGHIMCDRYNRRMYLTTYYNGPREYINRENFVSLANPVIALNGNYRWTFKAALSTLVHEMCHYYTYKDGFAPTKAHGQEFYDIASRVSSKSNEFFTVERLASAEEMKEIELDPKVKARQDARLEKRMTSFFPVLVFMNDDSVRLVNCKSQELFALITAYAKMNEDTQAVFSSDNDEVRKFIFSSGKKSLSRVYRYYPIDKDHPIVKEFLAHPYNVLFMRDSDNTNLQAKPSQDTIEKVNEELLKIIRNCLP